MKPAALLKVRISTTPELLPPLLHSLYESSIMHVEGVGEAGEFKSAGIRAVDAPRHLKEVSELKRELLKIHHVREGMKREKIIKPSFREVMGAEKRAKIKIPGGIDEELKFVRESARKILDDFSEVMRRIEREREARERLDELYSQYEPLRYFSLPIRLLLGETSFDVRFAITREPEHVERFLSKQPVGFDKIALNVKKNEWMYAIYFLKIDRGVLAPLFKRRLTVEYQVAREDLRSVMREYEIVGEDLGDILEGIRERMVESEKFLKEVAGVFERKWRANRALYLATLEELTALQEKFMGWRRAGASKYLTFLWGWVDEEKGGELKRLVRRVTRGEYAMDMEGARVEEDPPILLKNPKSIRDLQGLVEMYGHPNYNSVDPTLIVSFFFVLFIGLMIGDAGYGLVILILSIIFHYTLGRDNERLGQYARVGLYVGTVTIISGIAMGSFFGDLVPRFFYGDPSKPLYSATLLGIRFPVDPMKDPMKIFALSLVLGLIQMNIGFILGLYQRAFLQGNVKGAITGYVSWFLMEIGGGALLGDLLLEMWSLNHTQTLIFTGVFLVGFALLFLESKMFAIFDLEGFAGDWISYSRILALGLATAGMAGAINILAEMFLVGSGPLRIVLALLAGVLLFFGHLINTALQTLGAIVHSLRLQYSEFMGKFYEGGGRPFKVFGRNRIYTTIKEKKYIYQEVQKNVGE
ncbi:MAG: hypothetical protein J7L88_03445 [Thermoplasmata archaeon]|nr:hypothetical protein [Thermoplasmata archaeon]